MTHSLKSIIPALTLDIDADDLYLSILWPYNSEIVRCWYHDAMRYDVDSGLLL